MKLKAGVLAPEEEVRVLESCCYSTRTDYRLRIDPNGVWSVPTAVRMGLRLEPSPRVLRGSGVGTHGQRGGAQQVRLPIATNMYPARFDDLAPGIRLDAVDIVLTDIHYWEGPRGVKELAAVCRAFGLGVAMHSGCEFGIELAAMLHTAAPSRR